MKLTGWSAVPADNLVAFALDERCRFGSFRHGEGDVNVTIHELPRQGK